MNKKFRIWRKDFKRWLTPDDSSLHCQSNWSIDPFTGKVIDWIAMPDNHYHPEEEKSFHICDGKLIKESPFVIQQWTGLLDINGKEIFEGDILRCTLFKNKNLSEVVFKDGSYVCYYEGNRLHTLNKESVGVFKFEIAFNIFEK